MQRNIQFSCCSGRLSKTSQLCTKAWFLSQLNSAEVAEKVRKYREEGDEQAKGSLPASRQADAARV